MLLWISADPGCGKSVLAKSLVDHDLRQDKEPVSVCYFFFKDNEEQDRLGTALCAILHQLFDQQHHLLRHALPVWKRDGEKMQHQSFELWRILLTALSDPKARPVVCVLDALDECGDSDRQQLIKWLCDLYRQVSIDGMEGRLKFLVTSRPYDNVKRWFGQLLSTLPEIRLRGEDESDQVEQEINLVIDQHVKNLAREFSLSARSSEHFRRQLRSMNNRTYLWLSLAIDEIRHTFLDSPNPDYVQLDGSLPTSVEDAYERILQKVRPQQQRRVSKILLIIVGARRPLLTHEMAAALEVATTEPFRSEHLAKYIREWCGLFVYINHSRLFLIHKTAKEFLLANDSAVIQASSQWKSSLNLAMVEREMGRVCVEYLCRNNEDTQAWQQQQFYKYCAEHWASHLRDDEIVNDTDMLGKVLSLYATSDEKFKSWFPIRWRAYRPWGTVPQLLDQHIIAFHDHGYILDILHSATGFDVDARDNWNLTALMWAAECGHERIVQILLTYGADVNIQGIMCGSALQVASAQGHRQVVQILLDHGASVNARGGKYGNALEMASTRGHEQVVQILLDHGADVNARGRRYGKALEVAAAQGHQQVVQILLHHGADVNARGQLFGSALEAASAQGHDQVVQTLLGYGADVNAPGGSYDSALEAASARGHEQVVQILLTHGADVNIQNRDYGSALLAASERGHRQVVQILLDHGANVNTQVFLYGSALGVASKEGHEQVAQVLLAHGADVNAQCGVHGSALEAASLCGHEQVVQTLIAYNADINTQGEYRVGALQAASVAGHGQIVQILLDHGASVNARGCRYGNALEAASLEGHEQIVQTLIAHGADVNARGGKFGNALQVALNEGHEQVVQILLEAGALKDEVEEMSNCSHSIDSCG